MTMRAAMEPVSFYFVAWTAVLLPYMALKSARMANSGQRPIPPFTRMQLGTLYILTFSFALAMLTARRLQIVVFATPHLRPAHIVVGIGMLAMALGSVPWRFRVAPAERRERLLKILPQRRSDLW